MNRFDENDLIAYHLNELPLRRKSALESALQVDAALAAESEAIAETLRGFKEHCPFELSPDLHGGLVEWNWKVLSPALPRYPAAKPTFFRRHLPMLAGAGMAFAAVSVTFIKWHRMPAPPAGGSHLPPANAPRLTVSRPDAPIAPHTLLPHTARGNVGGQQQPTGALRHGLRQSSSMPQTPLLAAAPTAPSLPIQVTASAVASPNLPTAPLTAAVVPSAPTALLPGVSSASLGEPKQASAMQTVATGVTGEKRGHIAVRHQHTTELTLAMGGTLISSHYQAFPGSQGATHAVIAMASFHQQFRPAAGYRAAISYTRPDFFYGSSNVDYINGKSYEAAATYVVEGPGRGKLSTSAEAGAGVMRLVPTIKDPTTGDNTRVAGIFGVSADLMLSKRIGIHAAYRGQVFKGPDFQYSGISAPLSTSVLLSNEPSLGITYRFSPR